MSPVLQLSPALLRSRPLPRHVQGDNKEGRGRVMVVGGDVDVAGGALLAATAALRAGAGKLQIATCESVARAMALAMPECRVFRLPETPAGAIAPEAAEVLKPHLARCAALVVGPGMMDEAAAAALVAALLADPGCPEMLLDAGALAQLPRQADALSRRAGRTVITPHAGEMAQCLGIDIEAVEADPVAVARRAAAALHCVVALKGGCTRIVAPDGQAWESSHGDIGLGTSGSGDTLSGIIGGLMARGADPITATLWGVWAHAEAGERLARKCGPLGFLAREIPGEIPAILGELSA
jgi:ADP-dependent NAD(P)H-hydrate dehydratase